MSLNAAEFVGGDASSRAADSGGRGWEGTEHRAAAARMPARATVAYAVLLPCCAATASLTHVTALPTSLLSSFAEPPCTELKRVVWPPAALLLAKWSPKLSLHVADYRKHRLPPLRH